MLMNRILDPSDPLRDLDEPSRPLKRSASVASLPTPPRTHHKRTKRRRQEKAVIRADETEEEDALPLTYRVKAPVSPPPSRRRPLVQPARAPSVEDVPVTPPRTLRLRAPSPTADVFKTPAKSRVTKILPERDSPNNPFLVESTEKKKVRSEWDSSDEEEEVVGEAPIREPTPTPTYEEKPTITYVFRGQKATFHNPLYGLAPEVIAASKLPIDHPDYEATEACPPKRLFVSRKSRDHGRGGTPTLGVKHINVRQLEEDHVDTSEGEQVSTGTGHYKTEDADSAREERERREAEAKSRLAPKDGLRAGAVYTERDEPARRAMGPPRSA